MNTASLIAALKAEVQAIGATGKSVDCYRLIPIAIARLKSADELLRRISGKLNTPDVLEAWRSGELDIAFSFSYREEGA